MNIALAIYGVWKLFKTGADRDCFFISVVVYKRLKRINIALAIYGASKL
jgi:hypothetical protein